MAKLLTGQMMRIRDGRGPWEGYLEVSNNNYQWGIVCDEPYEWSIAEASVVCRQLGFHR